MHEVFIMGLLLGICLGIGICCLVVDFQDYGRTGSERTTRKAEEY